MAFPILKYFSFLSKKVCQLVMPYAVCQCMPVLAQAEIRSGVASSSLLPHAVPTLSSCSDRPRRS